MKLNELFELYLEDIDLTHQDTTLDSIRYVYNSGLAKKYGNKKLESIKFKEIKKYQKELLNGKHKTKDGKTYSISYINKIIALLKRLLKYANIMSYGNFTVTQIRGLESVTSIIDKKAQLDTQIIWSIKDFNNFLKVVDNERDRLLFSILYYTGMRKGELLSLCWKDVDLIDQTITINTTACRVRGKGQCIKPPKSKSSHRIIYINRSLNEMLLNHFIKEKQNYTSNIKQHYGFGGIKMISFSTLGRIFNKYKEKSNVTNMNLHGFRHSHATLMLNLTNDVYNVSKRLGHENIVITDTYLHVNAKIQREMVEKLEFAIHQEEVNTYDVFIEGLKKTLLKQITNETYSSDQTETLKDIYDFINN